MDRTLITPGRLYARMSAEFRRMRPDHCGNCRMPMVLLTHRASPDACNWTVENLGTLCEACRPLVAAIIDRFAEEYDINDPVSMPFFPRPPQVSDHHLRRS